MGLKHENWMKIVLHHQSFMAALVPNICVIHASMLRLVYYFEEKFPV